MNDEYKIIAMCSPDTGMSLNEYQQIALNTAICPHDHEIPYLALALNGEAGEVADKVKKVMRDKRDQFFAPDIQAIALELGDVLYYMALLAKALGHDLADIALMNIDKINGRLERGTLHGSGDIR